jgi:diguanylate cyclase
VLYQPLVQLDTGVIVGAEALVRWNHPERGTLGPDEFVPFAEECGVIEEMGDWVLTTVVGDMRAWKAELGGRSLPIEEVSINVSASSSARTPGSSADSTSCREPARCRLGSLPR